MLDNSKLVYTSNKSKATLRYIEGDATRPQKISDNKSEVAIIPHCCNDLGVWGGGFVIALSQRWEQPEKVYREYCKKYNNILGTTCFADIGNGCHVANMIGQKGLISISNPTPIKYDALMKCMRDVKEYIEKLSNVYPVIHAPKFGSLRAGGNWDTIEKLIENIWVDNGINVIVYNYA